MAALIGLAMGQMLAPTGADGTARLRHNGIKARRLPSPPGSFPMWLIDVTRCRAQALETMLSDDERERAGRFKTEALQNRYVTAHASLRILLSDFYGIPPSNLVMKQNELGKPKLMTFPLLHHSMSYSANYVMIGLNAGDEIGVDIEVFCPISDAMELANIYFTRNEQDRMRSAGDSSIELSKAFLKIWVQKEAVVKAFGCGLSVPLYQLECSGEDRPITVQLSEGRRCETGVLQHGGDPNMAWARRTA